MVGADRTWVPHKVGASLYIRPFIIATDNGLGVHASHSYLFAVICCPVGAYYPEGAADLEHHVHGAHFLNILAVDAVQPQHLGEAEEKVTVNGGSIGPLTQRLYDTLTGIQWGTQPDPYGWVEPVE